MRVIAIAALIIGSLGSLTFSQTPPPSIFLIDTSNGGGKAAAASRSLESQLYQDIADNYPCIDMLDKSEAEALIEYQRMIDLLGGKPNEALLGEIGGAMGASYVTNVHAERLGNGTYYLQIKVYETKSGRFVVMEDAPPIPESGVNAAIDALRAKALADMANFLNDKCDEHWTGTISFDYKYEKAESKNAGGIGGAVDYAMANTTSEHTEKASDTIYVTLQPMSLGMNGATRPKARVARFFDYHRMVKVETRQQTRCRPRGANSYLRNTVDKRSEKMEESGEIKAVSPVYIYLFEDGRYQIRVEKIPDIVTKWTREDIEQRPGGCEDPPPVTAASTGENSVWAASYKHAGADIEGNIDPKKPDVLAGKLTLGNAEAGVQIVTWNLKRIRPKPRWQK